jgi:hypothetical protein
MNYQAPGSRWKKIFTMIQTQGIDLAYFLGSQKELGPRLRAGEAVVGAPASDLDLGVVLLAHPLDFWEGQKLRQRRQDDLAPFFAPCACISCGWQKNAHVQDAAIRGIQVYAVNKEFAARYRPPGFEPLGRLAFLVASRFGII